MSGKKPWAKPVLTRYPLYAGTRGNTALATGQELGAGGWLALCLCFFLFGGLVGWGTRVHTTGDRYIKALVERHEAAANYYNERTYQLIHATEPKSKGVKTP